MNGSIETITGTLGGGKTLFAVERIYDHLEAGGYVYTNVVIYPEKVAERMASRGYAFDPSRLVILSGDLSEFHKQVARGSADSVVMVVIDEAHLSFNSRDWQDTDRDLLNFNTLVRKLDIQLLYITQDPTNLDKQFRKMSSITWVCRNFRHFKVLGVLPMPLPLMFRVCFDTTRGTGKGHRTHTEINYRKSFALGMYDTDALLGESAQRISSMRQVRGSPLQRIKPVKPSTPPAPPFGLEPIIALCAAFSVFF